MGSPWMGYAAAVRMLTTLPVGVVALPQTGELRSGVGVRRVGDRSASRTAAAFKALLDGAGRSRYRLIPAQMPR